VAENGASVAKPVNLRLSARRRKAAPNGGGCLAQSVVAVQMVADPVLAVLFGAAREPPHVMPRLLLKAQQNNKDTDNLLVILILSHVQN
jgi:hypothetical protein